MLLSDTKPHKYKVGDRVKVARPPAGNVVESFLDRFHLQGALDRPDEVCEVVRLRPADEHGCQYHVRPLKSGPERLVREDQLDPAG